MSIDNNSSSRSGSNEVDAIIKGDQKYWKIDPRRGQALLEAKPKTLGDVKKLVEAAQKAEQKTAIVEKGIPLCRSFEEHVELARIAPADSNVRDFILRVAADVLIVETRRKLDAKYGNSLIENTPQNRILADFERKYFILTQMAGNDLLYARLSNKRASFDQSIEAHNLDLRLKESAVRVIEYDEFVGQKADGKSPPMVQSSENPQKTPSELQEEEHRRKRQRQEQAERDDENRRRAEQLQRIQNNLLGIPSY